MSQTPYDETDQPDDRAAELRDLAGPTNGEGAPALGTDAQAHDDAAGAPADSPETPRSAVPRLVKTAVRRPGAKEGGRREEERHPGISIRQTDGPHNRKVVTSFSPGSAPNCNVRSARCAKVPRCAHHCCVKCVQRGRSRRVMCSDVY